MKIEFFYRDEYYHGWSEATIVPNVGHIVRPHRDIFDEKYFIVESVTWESSTFVLVRIRDLTKDD